MSEVVYKTVPGYLQSNVPSFPAKNQIHNTYFMWRGWDYVNDRGREREREKERVMDRKI